jgi:hypothetical protein
LTGELAGQTQQKLAGAIGAAVVDEQQVRGGSIAEILAKIG